MKIKERWQKLDPKNKKKVIYIFGITVILIAALLGYVSTRGGSKNVKSSSSVKEEEISLKPHILQKGVSQELRMKQQDTQKEMEKLKESIRQLQQEKAKQKTTATQPVSKTNVKNFSVPPPPPPMSNYAGEAGTGNNKIKPAPEIIGGISIASNTNAVSSHASESKKKEQGREVYLPPSFMEATLLSGLDAPTIGGAKGNPVPVLLRVKAPAVLPNDVKANLKGCFVIAEGIGRLDTERVELRLVSLSCIAKNGQAVIDQKVKGFVVDSDGKIGLRGRVVAKLGATLARAALAGFVEGFGNAVNQASQTTYASGLGTTTSTSTDTSDIFRSAAGKGIAKSSHKLSDFYMKLAEQSLPVIEVGATKRVTLVVSQGVELKIKKVCVGGSKCGE